MSTRGDRHARSVVVIGNFDGLHRGHQVVIGRAKNLAEARDLPLVAVTFDPHPMAVLRPQHPPPTLTTIEMRTELLVGEGVDHVVVLQFDREMAQWSPGRFVSSVIVERLCAAVVVVGDSFRFGRRAAGDVSFLRQQGAGHDFEVCSVALEGGPQIWSSTYVRTCLAAGDVEGAAEALGRPFAVRGLVVAGVGRAGSLGFPTANLILDGHLTGPPDGMYAGLVRSLGDHETWPSAINGVNVATADGGMERRVDSHVLDGPSLDLRGAEVEVAFTGWLHGMPIAVSMDEQLTQFRHDVERVRGLLPRAMPEQVPPATQRG